MKDDLILKFHDSKTPISRCFWRRLSNSLMTGCMLFLAAGIIGIFAALIYAVVLVVL